MPVRNCACVVVTIGYKHLVQETKIDVLCFTFVLSLLKAKMHFTMSDNALAHKYELDRIRSLLANASGQVKIYTPDIYAMKTNHYITVLYNAQGSLLFLA